MTVQFKKTPKGEVAILPRAEYEKLVRRANKANESDEDAGTARIVDRALADIEAGAPLYPMDVADALATGENAVRVIRKWRGLTQVELAKAVGIGQGYLSSIENGERRGTDTLRKIARVLNVSFETLAD